MQSLQKEIFLKKASKGLDKLNPVSVKKEWIKRHWVLDLGTKTFSILGAKNADDQPLYFSCDSRGIKRSTVVDIQEVSSQIEQLIHEVEVKTGESIRKLTVLLGAQNIESFRSSASLDIKHQTINSKVLDKFHEKMELNHQRSGKEILDHYSLSFQIDQREPTINPLGFSGKMLHGESILIFADQSYLRDLIDICNRAGCKVEGFLPDSLALFKIFENKKLARLGHVICDIGAGSSKGIIVQDDRIVSCFKMPMGGDSWTQDISIGLSISQEEAEKVKITYGMESTLKNHVISVRNIDDKITEITGSNVEKIVRARSLEFSSHLSRELMPYKGLIPGGIFLTGGASLLQGFPEYLSLRLRVPVNLQKKNFVGDVIELSPQNFQSLAPRPERSVLYGALTLYFQKQAIQNQSSFIGQSLRNLGRWVAELSH